MSTVELIGHPIRARFKGPRPPDGTVFRSPRRWYVVMATTATSSDTYPWRINIGRVSSKTAQALLAAGASEWSFYWDRRRRK